MNDIFQFIPSAVTFIGAVLVLIFSPVNLTMIDGGTFTQDTAKIQARIRCRNLWLRVGLGLVVVGAAGQLVMFIICQC